MQIFRDIYPIKFSSDYDYDFNVERNERLLSICKLCGATDYYSGPAARTYLDEALFEKHGIRVHWLDYTGYPEYNQLYPPFEHHVSIIDLLLNEGKNSPTYMKYV